MAKMQIKRVGVLSYAKISSVIMAGVGLIYGILYGIFIMIFVGAMAGMGGRSGAPAAGFGIAGGLMVMIVVPIIFAVMGFISGVIGALIYNFAAGMVGGIELELESTDVSFVPPPQPQQWNANQYQPGQQQQYPY